MTFFRYLTAAAAAVSISFITGCSSPNSSGGPGTPTAQDDLASTQINTATTINVLANDSDPQNDPLTVSNFAPTSDQGGTVSKEPDERLTYTPATDFTGEDSFRYTIDDGNGNTATATVQVIVLGNTQAVSDNPCRNVSARLNAGLGYCFDASFFTTHDRTDTNDPRSGTLIDMTVYVPHPDALAALGDDGNASHGFSPLVVHSHGFGGSKYEDFSAPAHFVDAQTANRAWNSGYFAVSFSQRGFGVSGGQIAFMQREFEGLDNNEVVDWMMKHMRGDSDAGGANNDSIYEFNFDANNDAHIDPSFDAADTRPSLLRADNGDRLTLVADCPNEDDESCDPAIGALGYSYGGGWQYNVAISDTIEVNGRTPQDRWDALIPEGTWHDLRYALHANDTPKGYWATLLLSFALEGGTLSNGEPLPDFLVAVAQQAATPGTGGVICDQGPADLASAGTATGRVCAPDQNFLGSSGTNKWCDPVNGSALTSALFHIQGVRDTLFDFNEGYDNAQCFRRNGNDTRLLQVSGGHPLTIAQHAPYTNQRTSMDIDEIVHCAIDDDIDGDGDNTDGDGTLVQERLYVQDMMYRWFEEKLRGQAGVADVIPDVCIAQHNTDPSDSLDGDDNFFYSGNSEFYYLKEGLTYFDEAGGDTALDQILIGAGDTPNYSCDDSTDENCPVDTSLLLLGSTEAANSVFVPLYTVDETRVMAGIPTAKLNIAGRLLDLSGNAVDPVLLAGIAIERDGGRRILHDQLTAIRDTAVFPWADPWGVVNNDIEDNDETETPLYYGCGQDAETLCERGRLVGVTARLLPGDIVGIEFKAADSQYPYLVNGGGLITITGDVQLPVLAASDLPETNEPYDPTLSP